VVRIEAVDTLLIDVPTIRPHVLAMATMHCQTLCLVRIRCSDGTEGIGEATTIGGLSYGPESPEGIQLAIDTYFRPVLLTCDAKRPAAAMAAISAAIVDNFFAKCAIETALLDAQGKRFGLPLSELLGGRLRDSVPVLWTLASGDTRNDIEEAERMLEARRHDAFKLKIGKRSVAEDVAHVAAIKRELGDRASIRVDVNQAWSESNARLGLRLLADAGVDLVEQPIDGANHEGLARLRALGLIPIMTDEALRGPHDALSLASSGAADAFSVKIEQSGGLTAARRVQAIAEAAGVELYGGTMLEAGIGTIASAQLFATFPRLHWGTELFGPLLLTEEILAEPLAYGDFALALPTGPGLGVALDEERVAFLRRGAARRTHSIPTRART
jgi:muconate cycloisomerase